MPVTMMITMTTKVVMNIMMTMPVFIRLKIIMVIKHDYDDDNNDDDDEDDGSYEHNNDNVGANEA